MRESNTWRDSANHALAPLFADGRQPTPAEVRDAYPFGYRAQWPYKVWLQQVRWYRRGCPAHARTDGKPKNVGGRKHEPIPREQAALL